MSSKATQWQYHNGVKDETLVSPDAPTEDQALLDRPGNQEIQLDLFYDYRTNIPLYPQWQEYFRKYQPPMLVMWGQNDEIFVAPGAGAYKKDLPNAEIHMYDTGHFALETNGPEMARNRDSVGRLTIAAAAERLIRSGARMKTMLDDPLDYNKTTLAAGLYIAPTEANLGRLCSTEIEDFQSGHRDRTIQLELKGNLEGRWDTARLQQLLSNLLSNACAYGDPDAPHPHTGHRQHRRRGPPVG